MAKLDRIVSYEDYRRAARARLPRILFDYIDGGSYDEVTLARNTAAFRAAELVQRVMVDVSGIDSAITPFGETLSMPLVLAPVGFAGMYARRGEVQAARAAARASIPFCLSTVGICSIDEVARGAGTPPWFQLYMIRDRAWCAEMLARAREAGCRVLVLTADLQAPGARYRDVRSGMMRTLGPAEHLARLGEGVRKAGWSLDVFARGRPHSFGNLDGVLARGTSFPEAWRFIAENFDPSLNWDDLAFVREHWKGPIVLKGVMTREDARLAVEHELDAIVVSNHGGRQLDGAPATLSVLPGIAEAVDGRLEVLVDGGVRSGLDVLKAVRHGARACLIGRPWAFALAAAGEAGVAKMLETWRAELKTAQVLSAATRLQPGG
ncbi:L-lactate dehydrogenase [Marinicauda algicola]|uniref:L-lactate dehydrogenase n=1 Tax=Marinicauda algicola TaxID=2029849 RepID=A0A4S2GZM7_9PROT|nr:L-lactate dehydrogenase [Marinicauda algicola]TGY88391.1 L-lactate dehydrogenase [Marinicauda algicola]